MNRSVLSILVGIVFAVIGGLRLLLIHSFINIILSSVEIIGGLLLIFTYYLLRKRG